MTSYLQLASYRFAQVMNQVKSAAIHGIHIVFKDEKREAVVLVDVANAFNPLNREVFLYIHIICPPKLSINNKLLYLTIAIIY